MITITSKVKRFWDDIVHYYERDDCMKKWGLYIIMILCYFASNIACNALNMLAQSGGMLMLIITLILTIIFSIAFAFLSFYIPQKIRVSEKGLRYKVMSVITLIIGIALVLSVIATINENIGLTNIFNPYILLSILLSLLNPAFIFGITLFILYRSHYKNNLINKL